MLEGFTISYQSLLPSTAYSFRVIAYNLYGISNPAYSDKVIVTPSKLYLEYGYLQYRPFYRRTWFMVALAAASIIIIIMVIAILCVKSKSYKYKSECLGYFTWIFINKSCIINCKLFQKKHKRHWRSRWQVRRTNVGRWRWIYIDRGRILLPVQAPSWAPLAPCAAVKMHPHWANRRPGPRPPTSPTTATKKVCAPTTRTPTTPP